jgi:di/tricarboxylate transporter
LAQEYGVARNLTRVRVGPQTKLLGKTLAESDIGGRYGVSVVLIEYRAGLVPRWIIPSPQYRMQLGDDLYLEGSDEAMWTLSEEERAPIGLPGEQHVKTVLRRGVCLAEVAVPPRSQAVGRALRDLDFRNRYGLSVLSIWRHGTPKREGLGDMELETGDALLLAGPAARVRELSTSDDFILLSEPGETSDYRKAPLALLFLAVAMVPPLFGWAPLAISAVAGALLMAGTGCVSMSDAARFVEWKVLFLVIGTLPLGEALEIHGVADQAAQGVLGSVSAMGPPGVLAALFLLAAVISVTSSNAAAAVILAPVAWRAAEAIDIEPSAALLAVAYGCSCAFLVPFAHPCNLLVWVPGGYRTRDFAVVGAGLSIVVAAVAVTLLAVNGSG